MSHPSTRTTRHLFLASAVLALAAACGSTSDPGAGHESDSDAPSTTREISNPVDVLKKFESLGCVIPAGTEVGKTDMSGNKYASCDFMDNSGTGGTSINVRTFPGDPAVVLNGEVPTTDDGHKVILGSDFILTIGGDWATYSKDVDPQEIARIAGGTYLAP